MFAALVMLAISNGSFSQQIDPSSLLGDWEGMRGSQKIEFNFRDSNRLSITGDLLENMTCPYSIQNIQGQNILLISVNPKSAQLKIFLWMNAADEIKLLSVDELNYNNPMKNPPTGGESGCVIMKRKKSSISG
jgi:hypothetical protein